ncbi:TIGR04282 family arsenosugar biosynthesis glycosyltransferase [Streptomyces sp. NPDC086519]|uniref:TIGR04282 family arsenosugar biosynthesis glycosyltransferase n=1 Tax=Streptomyces sp. NPDC086519 TaxID=3154863 RepID=UPI00341B6FD1
MSAASTPAVLVMAKAPRPGSVKTRLHPLLGPHGCAALQAELIRHTVDTVTATGLRAYVAYTHGPGDGGAGIPDVRVAAPPGVRTLVQRGQDLGQRLTAAVSDAFSDGGGPVLVIGTDAPTLTRMHLAAALTALQNHDVVLGPALDGGYYLIGTRRPHTDLFALDPMWWSTDKVLAATLALAAEAGLSAELLAPLRDLDTPEDAAALLADPGLPPAITAVLASSQSREDG